MRLARSLVALASLFAALVATPALARSSVESCSSDCCKESAAEVAMDCCGALRSEPCAARCACHGELAPPPRAERRRETSPLAPVALEVEHSLEVPKRALLGGLPRVARLVHGPPAAPLFILHRALLL